jgi:thymidylate kinase
MSRNSSLVEAMRYLALAIDRHRAMVRARRLADRGFIVITDRFPSLSPGKMDSPRIVAAEGCSSLVRALALREQELYKKMASPDLLIRLQVPLEVAIERNRKRVKVDKETDDEIRGRYEINVDLDYGDCNIVELDTNREFADTLRQVRQLVWEVL